MDRLKKGRRPVRAQLTKIINEAEQGLAEENPDKNNLRILMDNLEHAWYKLQEWDDKIKEQMLDDDTADEEQDKEYEEIRKYGNNFLRTRGKLNDVCNQLPPRPVSPTPSEAHSTTFSTAAAYDRRQLQLPKIELQKFNGELKEWLGFWSQFRKIHENVEMEGCDKLHYLQQSMVVGTTAHQIVSSYPQTSENYPKVVEALTTRYGNDDVLLQVYVRELLKLVISNVNARDKIPLESLVLQLDSHLRALETLKLNEADPATWLFPLVESSLPEEILLTWQRSPLSEKDGSQDEPKKTRLAILMEFLKKEVAIIHKIQLAQTGFQEEISSKKKPPVKKDNVPTLSGFHISDQNSCIFCGKQHPSQECFSAMKMSLADKKKIITDKRACYTCLKVGHHSAKCRAMVKCVTCGRKHHAIMCNQGKPQQQQSGMNPESAPVSKSADWVQPKGVRFEEDGLVPVPQIEVAF